MGRHAGAVLRRRRVACACSRTTSATSPCRGPSWPACPTRSRPPPRCSTASWSPPTSDGRPSFGLLQQRMHVTDAGRGGPTSRPRCRSAYVVFDLLHLDGHDLTGLPLTDRRRLLDQVLEPGAALALLAAARRRRRRCSRPRRSRASRASSPSASDSRYEPGKRTPHVAEGEGAAPPGDGGGRVAARRGQPLGPPRRAARRLPRRAGRRRPAPLRGTGRAPASRRPSSQRLGRLFDDLATDECPFDPPPPRAEILAAAPRWLRPELVAELELRRVDQRRPPPPSRATSGCAPTSPPRR